MDYKVIETDLSFRIFHFTINTPLAIEEFQYFMGRLPKSFPGDKGWIVSGRGPVWVHAALIHRLAPSQWLANFDPRLGAVVVSSSSPGRRVGEVIPLEQIREVAPELGI